MPNRLWGSGASGVSAASLAAHEADTTNVHGITDTAQIALKDASNTFTLQQLFPVGSAGTPSQSYAARTTDGAYSSASGTLGFATAGTARLLISSTGVTAQGSTPFVAPNNAGTTPNFRFGSSSCGVFGSNAANRIGMVIGSQVVFDASGNNSYVKVQTYPMKAEAGFSGGLYDLVDGVPDSGFVYVSNGATQLVTDTTGAVALQLGDDLTDASFVAGLGGAQITIKDATANGTGAGAFTNNITITDGGSLPIDSGTTITIDQDDGFVELTPCDGFWTVTGGIGFTLS